MDLYRVYRICAVSWFCFWFHSGHLPLRPKYIDPCPPCLFTWHDIVAQLHLSSRYFIYFTVHFLSHFVRAVVYHIHFIDNSPPQSHLQYLGILISHWHSTLLSLHLSANLVSSSQYPGSVFGQGLILFTYSSQETRKYHVAIGGFYIFDVFGKCSFVKCSSLTKDFTRSKLNL